MADNRPFWFLIEFKFFRAYPYLKHDISFYCNGSYLASFASYQAYYSLLHGL